MRWIEKIGVMLGLAVIFSMTILGTVYAFPVTNHEGNTTVPKQSPLSLCTFSWVQSNDDGTVSNHDGYSPIDLGGNTGNDPQSAQTAGASCTRTSYNAATTTATSTTDTITFNLSNVYPGYNPTIFFGLDNQGSTPGIVSSITFTNPNNPLLTMTLKGITNNQVINSGTEVVGALDVAVGDVPQSGTHNYSLSLTIMVTQTGAFSINPISLPDGQYGIYYNQTLTAVNGNPPYRWTITSGLLPYGMSLNTTTGAITGTPTATGNFGFTVQVADSTGVVANIFLSITVPSIPAPPSTITTKPVVTITVTPTTLPTTIVTLSKQVTTTTQTTPSAPGQPHILTIDVLGTIGQVTVNSDGSLAEPFTISLPDKSVSLTFSAGTIITADGKMPDRIEVEIASDAEQPGIPKNWTQVSKLYRLVAYYGDVMAEHTVFSHPYVLTIQCDATKIPDNAEVFTAYYQTDTGWVGINSTYNPETVDVSANINHFTLFAGMAKQKTAPPPLSHWWWIAIFVVAILGGLWLLRPFILLRFRKK